MPCPCDDVGCRKSALGSTKKRRVQVSMQGDCSAEACPGVDARGAYSRGDSR